MSGIGQIIRYINNHPLAKRNLLKAYGRFFKWQLSQRFSPRDVEFKLTEKARIWVKKGMTGATGSIYTGLHEFEDMSFLLHFLQKGELFADIGANVGIYSVLAAADCEAKTLTFEPAPGTFQWVERNRSLNKVPHLLKPFNIGIGEREEVLRFSTELDTINHVLTNEEKDLQAVEVPIKSFDSIVSVEGCPVLTKIDVEGFETPVIKGMQATLANPILQAIIIELNGSGANYGFDETWIHQELVKNGFTPCVYEPFSRSITPADGFGTHNTIYIKDVAAATERVKLASKRKIFGVLY